MITINPGMVIINENEYKQLTEYKEKKIQLEIEISKIYDNKRQLEEIIKTRDVIIEELKRENDELKKKIENLEEENTKLKQKIKELEERVKKQDVIIENQNERIKILEDKNLYKKYLMAIQDLNKIEGLETKLNNVSKNLVKFEKKQNVIIWMNQLMNGQISKKFNLALRGMLLIENLFCMIN